MVLAWILYQKGVMSVLVGASSTEQLQKNLKCINAELFFGCMKHSGSGQGVAYIFYVS
ncbi:MAG: aldo/keto reductase [Prevotella sp.]|nr:aldo/keto reductase [Prevotella sp.]